MATYSKDFIVKNGLQTGGDILPDADDTYSLGSASKKWAELHVSGSTIYLGDLVVKDNGDNTLKIFQSDGTTEASVQASSVDISYDNTASGLTAATVKAAIDEIAAYDTDNISEGSSNLYYTDARVRSAISASDGIAYNSSTGALSITDTGVTAASYGSATAIPVLTINANGQITAASTATVSSTLPIAGDSGSDSVSLLTDTLTIAGGTGLSTIASTDTITVALDDTAVSAGSYGSASQVPVITVDAQGRITAASTTAVAGVSSVSYTSSTGVLQIDTSDGSSYTNDLGVGTGDSPTFAGLTINGNLTVSGTTTTVNTETINLADNVILLNSNATGTPSENGGIEIERGDSTNKTLIWDETNDRWTVGSESFVASTFIGDLTGDVTGTVSSLSNHDTDDLSEGSTNLYYTTARWDSKMASADTDDLSEGSTNQYFTTARARSSISASGDLSYNSSTGVVSFTERTDSEVQGLISVTDSGGFGSLSKSGGTITYTGISTEEIQDVVGAMVSSNTESGISVTYQDTDGTLDFNVNDPTITLTGAVTGSGTMTNLGNVSIATTATADPTLTINGDASGSATFTNLGNATLTLTIADDSHNHTTSNIDGFTESVQDIAGGMWSSNSESGVSVVYQDGDGTLDINVNDPTITLTGAVTGSATMTNLGNVSISTTATADPTLTITGDASGSATFTNLGNASLSLTVANDSHTHDGRYYTETEADARFVRASAANTFTGQQTFDAGFISGVPFNYVKSNVSSNTTLTSVSGYQIQAATSTLEIDSGVTLTISSGATVTI